MAARADRPVPAAESRATVDHVSDLVQPTLRAPPSSAANASAESGRVKSTHKVRKGDTLASIARRYKTTVASLRSWNPRIPGDRLLAGQRLTVFAVSTR